MSACSSLLGSTRKKFRRASPSLESDDAELALTHPPAVTTDDEKDEQFDGSPSLFRRTTTTIGQSPFAMAIDVEEDEEEFPPENTPKARRTREGKSGVKSNTEVLAKFVEQPNGAFKCNDCENVSGQCGTVVRKTLGVI